MREARDLTFDCGRWPLGVTSGSVVQGMGGGRCPVGSGNPWKESLLRVGTWTLDSVRDTQQVLCVEYARESMV